MLAISNKVSLFMTRIKYAAVCLFVFHKSFRVAVALCEDQRLLYHVYIAMLETFISTDLLVSACVSAYVT
jgi:hypothetical protein